MAGLHKARQGRQAPEVPVADAARHSSTVHLAYLRYRVPSSSSGVRTRQHETGHGTLSAARTGTQQQKRARTMVEELLRPR